MSNKTIKIWTVKLRKSYNYADEQSYREIDVAANNAIDAINKAKILQAKRARMFNDQPGFRCPTSVKLAIHTDVA